MCSIAVVCAVLALSAMVVAPNPISTPDIGCYEGPSWPTRASNNEILWLSNKADEFLEKIEVRVHVSVPVLPTETPPAWQRTVVDSPFQIVSIAMLWPMNAEDRWLDSWQSAVSSESAAPLSFDEYYCAGKFPHFNNWKRGKFVCTVTPANGRCWKDVKTREHVTIEITLEKP